MRRALIALAAIAAVLVAAGWVLTRPEAISADGIAGIEPDLARGEWVFHAAGCASCHATPGAETEEERLVLSGGERFETPFGTFVAPNITPDPAAGIGSWARAEVVSAIARGTSPDGRHYYPSFPYAAYGKADLSDLVSLAAFLETLPADPASHPGHDLSFPFNIRAGVGLWKLLYAGDGWVLDAPGDDPIAHGRYLVEALGHCGECHTPRGALGGLQSGAWLAGAPNPSGRGNIPNITPGALQWSEADIAAYLETGFTPEFDVVGGSMTSVVRNFSMLEPSDRAAVAAYLKAIPAVE